MAITKHSELLNYFLELWQNQEWPRMPHVIDSFLKNLEFIALMMKRKMESEVKMEPVAIAPLINILLLIDILF